MLLTGNGIGNLGDPFFMLGFADLDDAPAVTALDELVQGSLGQWRRWPIFSDSA